MTQMNFPTGSAGLTDNYRLLIAKLDDFIRRFYVNKLIRGLLYSTGLLLLLFIGLNVLEYYFYFSPGIRKTMFWSFVGVSVAAIGHWIAWPLLSYFRLGKTISHEQAAVIIGEHFSDVKDKLLNVLQLRQMADISTSNRDLVLASINQKAESFKLVPFQKAIDLSENKKYLRYALPPLLLLLLILAVAPAILREGTYRILNNNKIFQRPAPFEFLIANKNLSVVQYEDFELVVRTQGKVVPQEVMVDINGFQYRMSPQEDGSFAYKFVNVQKDQRFFVFAGPVRSKGFDLDVIEKPQIDRFDVKLDYPAYTGRIDEVLTNSGDLVVPVGTVISWVFDTEHTDDLHVAFGDGARVPVQTAGSGSFTLSRKALGDELYKLYVGNKALPLADSSTYAITVTPDLHPSISVERFVDSARLDMVFFAGDASDDYSLRGVNFVYILRRADGRQEPAKIVPLPNTAGKATQFEYKWDLLKFGLRPGEEVTYYFEAWDNDGVHGSKSTRSQQMTYSLPSIEQLQKQEKTNNEEIRKNLKEAIKEQKDIRSELQKLREKMLQQKEVDWQTKKEFQKLQERQHRLEKSIEEAKMKFDENIKNQQQFDPADERIVEKQEQLQKMFDDLQNEELKNLMEEIQKLLEQLNRDEAIDKMEDTQLNNEQMEKELDRMLELFKKLEVEAGIEEAIEKLQELAEKQEELAKESEKGEKSAEQILEEQKKLNEEFDKIQKELEELDKKNKELDRPLDLDKQEDLQKEIDKDQKDAGDQLKKNDKNKASKSQKGASNKMKDMANSLAMKMRSGSQEQMEEDIAALRQILDNLVTLSFDQEALMGKMNKAEINTPNYVKLVQEQHKLKRDFTIIQDSLQALARRVFQLESFITEKVTDINGNMREAISQFEERRKPQGGEQQQRAMKNINDLALLLSETMNQMQQQMSGMSGGSKSCPKPGQSQGKEGRKPSDKISEGQQQLNEEMRKMAEQMKQGKGSPGGQPGSKEFAQMAAKQAAMREALRKKQKELQQRGKGDPGLQQIMDEMEKVETELVNKRLTNEMLKRQQDILTRLLESERAERERGYDEQRQAEQAREVQRQSPPALQEYLKKRQAEIELFKTVSPSLTPYYKQLVEEYYRQSGAQ